MQYWINSRLTVADQIQILVLFAAGIALFLNYFQMRRNSRQKVAEFIITLNNQFRSDDKMQTMYYEIEYGRFEYDQSFHGSDNEKSLDLLLEHFESLAQLYLLSNVRLKDLGYVAYNYLVVYGDSSVQKYFAFLDKWYLRKGMKVKPFAHFRKVAAKLERKFVIRSK